MERINFFCINLDSQRDRWKDCQKQFIKQGVEVKRWPAKPLPENRRFGAGLSHREIIEYAKNQDWDYVGVFEDDIQFITKKFLIHAQNALSELIDKKWYILYFGGCMRRDGELHKEKGLRHVLRVKRCVEAHAVVYHRRFFDIYLQKHPDRYTSEINEHYLDNKYMAFDLWFADVIQHAYPCYFTNKILVVQKDGFSIIENKLVNRRIISQYRFLAYKYLGARIVKYLDTHGRNIKKLLNNGNTAEKAEVSVFKFYNTVGWETNDEVTEDAKRFEDLREYSKEYVGKCRLRVLRHIPDNGVNMLDMASGPIQYKEYLEYSKNFKKRYCVDLSSAALEMAKKKIGDHGVFLHGSFLDIPMEENFFDCTISLHTIYHIDKDKQEEAVRKLLYVTKPEKKVIIVYSNPNTLLPLRLVSMFFRLLKKTRTVFEKVSKKNKAEEGLSLYFHPHPIEWWKRFSDIAIIDIFPWRSLDSNTQKGLIPNNKLGRKIFSVLFNLEERFPNFFVKYFQYPMIVLSKKKN